MSFILDALRRAQTANEHAAANSAPIYADRVPDAPADLRQRVLVISAALSLLCAVALLAWWLGRESAEPAAVTPAAVPVVEAPQPVPRTVRPVDRAPVRALDQEAARGRPTPAPTTTPTAPPARATRVTPGTVTVAPAPVAASSQTPSTPTERSTLPQYENLLVEGKINLPNLKMDMHVYNRQPTKRFVFINFKKFREGDALDRATKVEEITAQGAVLNYNGERFLLQPN